MEFVEGGSLASRLDGTPWPAQRAAALVEKLARAVHAAHERNIVHRDLKPANVLLTAADEPRIADFGLAKRLDLAESQTQTGAIVGTPSYMPPEQASETASQIGPSADIYALGAVLYELLTGRPPFKGETPLDTLLQVRFEEPVPPSRLVPKLSRDMETICLKCLEKEPSRRYPRAQSLADDLGRLLSGEPIHARRVTVLEKCLKWARRRPAVAALAAAVLLVALVGTGGVLWQWRQAVTARNQLSEALAAKSRLLTETERAKDEAERSARTSQRAADILTDTFQGVDRLGLISDFFLEGSEASTAEIRTMDLLNRAAGRVHEFDDDAPTKARLMDTLGIVLMSLGRVEEAADLLDGSLRIRSAQRGEDDAALAESQARSLARTRSYLATLRFVQGRHEEAAALADAAIASGYIELDNDVVALMLGLLRMETNESDESIREAGRLIMAATDASKGLGAKGHRQRALLLAYLVLIRQRRNEHSAMLELGLEAQASLERIEGGSDLLTNFYQWGAGLSEIEIADVFQRGDREAGLRRFRLAMNQFVEDMGATHLAVQFSLVEQARYFEMKGNLRRDPWYYDRADEVYRSALECLQKGCGRQPRTAMCLERLAGLLEKQDRREEAAEPWREALAIRSTILGADHRDTIRAREAVVRLSQPGKNVRADPRSPPPQ
jgi:tetratricopeptide (TPR) repeat protein